MATKKTDKKTSGKSVSSKKPKSKNVGKKISVKDSEEQVVPEKPKSIKKPQKISVNIVEQEDPKEKVSQPEDIKETENKGDDPSENASPKTKQEAEGDTPLLSQSEVENEDISLPENDDDTESSSEIIPAEEKTDQPNQEDEKDQDIVSRDDIEIVSEDQFDSKDIDDAVDDIVSKENRDDSVEKLDSKDPVLSKPKQTEVKRRKKKGKFLSKFIVLLIIALIGLLVYPKSRYFILNSLGVTSSVEVVVLDSSTNMPLKNVQVRLGDKFVRTNKSGKATLSGLDIGPSQLVIERTGFKNVNQALDVSVTDKKLPSFSLIPTGQQYNFVVTDFLSGKPIEGAEAVSGEASALSDSNGKIKLTVDITNEKNIKFTLSKEDYRVDEYEIPVSENSETQYKMVGSRKVTYFDKSTGKYDLYSMDLDGTNKKVILAGTGNETDQISLHNNYTSNLLAVVSTRLAKKDEEGNLLSSLTVLNTSNSNNEDVLLSPRIQVIGWVDNHLIFTYTKTDSKPEDPDRHKLASYNVTTKQLKEIQSTNYFNDVAIFNNQLYFSVNSGVGGVKEFIRINADGNGKVVLLNREVKKIYRNEYDKLVLAVDSSWLEMDQSGKLKLLNERPTNLTSKIFIDSPDGKSSLTIVKDNASSKLIRYFPEGSKEEVIVNQEGVNYPINWLNSKHVVYRVHNEAGYMDYVVNVEGGEPKVLSRVSPVNSPEAWYYY